MLDTALADLAVCQKGCQVRAEVKDQWFTPAIPPLISTKPLWPQVSEKILATELNLSKEFVYLIGLLCRIQDYFTYAKETIMVGRNQEVPGKTPQPSAGC